MVDEAGERANLDHRANGAVIEVVVDHSDGSLAFGVNGAPPQRVPNVLPPFNDPAWDELEDDDDEPAKVPFKFPQGARLRPWARVYAEVDDRVRFDRACYVET